MRSRQDVLEIKHSIHAPYASFTETKTFAQNPGPYGWHSQGINVHDLKIDLIGLALGSNFLKVRDQD